MNLPQSSEHSPSNTVDSTELSPNLSRKRQRSLSMQSDSGASSSSIKRTVADTSSSEISIRSPRTDQLSSLSIVDPSNQDIDAYMAEQGEDYATTFLFPPSQNESSSSMVSHEEKLSIVEKGKGKRMEIGETWYLVAGDWYKRWRKACSGEVDKEGLVLETDLGPVRNSSILDGFNNLLPSLEEGIEVEYVPQEIWENFVQWYGPSPHPLPRRVIARGAAKLPALELRPPRLKVFKLVKTVEDSITRHPWLTISSGESISKLCTELAKVVSSGEPILGPYRVWRVNTNLDDSNEFEFLSNRLSLLDAMVVEESDKTLEEEGIQSEDAFVVEFKQADGWMVITPKLAEKSTTSPIKSPRPLFNANDNFFNKFSKIPTLYDGLSSPSKVSTALTLSKKSLTSFTKTTEPGTLGLGNMGNTCFMNSALQCLAHTKELTEYFLTGVYANELNRDNPLGMGGAIAEAFGALLNRIWSTTGGSTSYSPREFKLQLQRFAPQFSGYQQHDSQELVAFLLDGLHEDLNRVIKKPYVEKPDWEGGGELELVKLAQKSWEGYMLRNDSIIVDLFQGQYQSTLICPECEKVSITFDPFMYLTLPLPIQKKWKHTIFYVPWDLEKPHVKVPVEINRDSSFKDLRVLLGRWMGVPPENLITLEIFNHKFYKNLDDHVPVGDMGDSDTIVCFELPCNARQNKAYKKQQGEPFIIPVYLCDAKAPLRGASGMYRSAGNIPQPFGYPMIIAIDRGEALDIESLYNTVAKRLQRWTEHARDLFTWEASASPYINQIPLANGLLSIDVVTEIGEDGAVVTLENVPLEGDIVGEKDMLVDRGTQLNDADDIFPRKVGVKKDIFELRLQSNHKDFGTSHNYYSSTNRYDSWDTRINSEDDDPVLLRDEDALFCEFEEDKKAYFFGDTAAHEHARWNNFEQYTHPEYEESKKAGADKNKKGINLQDCLEEFTKEEQLGEDDLWYCPQCKKHQQATKKFDIWKLPDILVVHLKRFSSNRTLRDKIDAHIEFPIEGLDLSEIVGERNIAKKLQEQGVDIKSLNLGDPDEDLVYDLFGVDEHIGGLGGGHYRAYTSNHITEKWYHFDDSYVTPARASDSVNANAYLLFYRRRTDSPLGGKSHLKIEEAKLQPKEERIRDPSVIIDTQLPTPPNEETDFGAPALRRTLFPALSPELTLPNDDSWNLRSSGSNAGSSAPSPPTDDPPEFEEFSSSFSNEGLMISSGNYDFADPSSKASPTSSNEVELDTDVDDPDWNGDIDDLLMSRRRPSPMSDDEKEWQHSIKGGLASPSSSDPSDPDPFNDSNMEKNSDTVTKQPDVHEKTT